MNSRHLLLLAATCATPVPAFAADAADKSADAADKSASATAAPAGQLMTTGVARARDRLDSATSTSTLNEQDIEVLGARSVTEIFRDIPGMRAEATGGEGFGNISIRGLPIALGGAKFLQIQENGIPTLEFGDIAFATADQWLRPDLNLMGVQAIRGGSASTFASNSPGGIVNLIDKTGEVDGGSLMTTIGLDYNNQRVDFTYGGHLSHDLRFQLGGFYRTGSGARETGFDGFKGGQFKFNVTKDFDNGFVRIYGKLLDDKTLPATYAPVLVTGTGADPHYGVLPGFDYTRDTLYSRNIVNNIALDSNNRIAANPYSDGVHSKMKSIGLEAKFDVAGWTINEKFRYADISGHVTMPYTFANASAALPFRSIDSAAAIMAMMHATSLSWATGPNAGQAIADPSTIAGNGLLALMSNEDVTINGVNNAINDLRASKVWDFGNSELTFTAGYYKSIQDIDAAWTWSTTVSDIAGGGNANLVNMAAGPFPLTQNGYLGYGSVLIAGLRHDRFDLNYNIDAPYGSLNWKSGPLSVGASLRYDSGRARGNLYGTSLPGATRFSTVDINGDGAISLPETRVSSIDYSRPGPVNYNYHYWSYSLSANYRLAENASLFARYSKGARANADRIQFTSYVSPVDGSLLVPGAAFDPVQQAEGGVKYRSNHFEAYLTGFWAKTREHNISLDRAYRAYGLEFETAYRTGVFSMTGGATWTKAKITADYLNPATVGNVPKHQADLIFQLTPKVETRTFTIGANFEGTTSSYSGDTNQLKMPGYVTVNAFVQVRPTKGVTLMLNANNLFDKAGLVEVDGDFIPVNNILTARTINPRTISGSVRFDF
ncbi:MAG: TonB-dependent receptor [Sphingomonadales bacterium]|nr:TonB-dependent receptor [Sphingomonadales bacterium]